MLRAAWLFFCVAALAGCATTKVSPDKQTAEITALTGELTALSPTVNPAEARRAAAAAVRYPLQLAQDWHVTPPALFNNVLVNCGLHPRGLCYQWADALTEKLLSLRLQTLDLKRGVARRGTRREHSCVVLTAIGQSFTNGIALDAWRNCGRLHFAPVLQDDYPWKETGMTPEYQAELRAAAARLGKDSAAQ